MNELPMEKQRMTRILFVDDEPNIRDGMRRMLRSMRNEWDMEFAESGDDALLTIDEWRDAGKPFDVVVSDMRMPGMDGADLLARVKEVSPDCVRLILSGHSDTASIMKTVGTAHQYLNKPCDPELLKRTIKRAFALRLLLRDEHLQKVVGQISSLPSLPVVYQEVMTCLQRTNASLGDVAKVIGKDVGMTATLLKLVSSAFFGLSKPVSTIERAVSFLGLDTLITLVLAQGIFREAAQIRVPGFSIAALWQHSLQTAGAARVIAAQEGLDQTTLDDAFLAGMLHDIGKLVLAQSMPDSYAEVMRQSAPATPPPQNRNFCSPPTPTSVPICSVFGA
jgi:response regulator RpfG family c-di-GMP phosphodiesterase